MTKWPQPAATVDHSYQREDAAFSIVRILQRQDPKDFDILRQRVRAEDQQERQEEIVRAWCRALRLSCDSIQMAALHLALDDKDGPVGTLRLVFWADSDGHLRDHTIEYRSRETKKSFLARAEAHFDQMREFERQGGSVQASNSINQRHVEWLVRFQVWNETITAIVQGLQGGPDRKQVRQALRAVATLLGLTLREAPSGRPRGRMDSGQKRHVVRR